MSPTAASGSDGNKILSCVDNADPLRTSLPFVLFELVMISLCTFSYFLLRRLRRLSELRTQQRFDRLARVEVGFGVMRSFTRLRSDGALSIDLDNVLRSTTPSNVYTRDEDRTAVSSRVSHAEHATPPPAGSYSWLENVSPTTVDDSSVSPVPHRPSSLVASGGIGMQVNLLQLEFEQRQHGDEMEEDYDSLRECTFHPRIDARSRRLASSRRNRRMNQEGGAHKTQPEEKEVGEEEWRSSSRRGSSQQVFDKLFTNAKELQDRLDEICRMKTEEGMSLEKQEKRFSLPTSTSSLSRGDALNYDDGAVFNRLYAQATEMRSKQEEACRQREEERREEEEKEILTSPQRRRRRKSEDDKATRMTELRKKELFERLAMPARKREDKTDDLSATPRNRKTRNGKEQEEKEEEEPQRYTVQWPPPSMTLLTLADLERHSKMTNRVH